MFKSLLLWWKKRNKRNNKRLVIIEQSFIRAFFFSNLDYPFKVFHQFYYVYQSDESDDLIEYFFSILIYFI